MSSETPVEEIKISGTAWKALEGAYDLQIHVGPDVIARRIDDIDCAKEFLAHGMKGFVLKSHYIQTGERAQVVTKAVPGSKVFGAITLNHSVGGLNPVAVELAGRTGCKIVWFPTVDAANETAGRLDGGSAKLPFWAKIQRELAAEGISPPPLTVIDEAGRLTEPTRRCLERIAKHNMILATGPRRPPRNLCARARSQRARREESGRHARRVPVAEPHGRRAERARGSGGRSSSTASRRPTPTRRRGTSRLRTSGKRACRARSFPPTSARRSTRRSPKGSPCSPSVCSTPGSRPMTCAPWR